MSRICVIPARGGSKRIPRKNIRDFLGIPIIGYSIKAALESELFDEVMVSTDDDEIADIATSFGANVPFLRSEKNSGDFATTVDVLIEVLKDYQPQSFSTLCCIYPSAPFVSSEILRQACYKLENEELENVFPVIQYSYPIQRALRLENNVVRLVNEEFVNARSQDLEPRYHDAGQFYMCNVEALQRNRKVFTAKSGAVVISELFAQDIDNETDWKLAELKFKLRNEFSRNI